MSPSELENNLKTVIESSLKMLEGIPSRKEFMDAFKALTEVVTKSELALGKRLDAQQQANKQELVSLEKTVQDSIAEMKSASNSTFAQVRQRAMESMANFLAKSNLDGKMKAMMDVCDQKMSEMDQKMLSMDDKMDSIDLEKMKEEIIASLPEDPEETAEDIATKLNEHNGIIEKHVVDGLEDLEKEVQEISLRPTSVGGAKGIGLYIGGAKKLLTAQQINLIAGSGISLTYNFASGRNDITIAATGGAVLTILAATGTINDSNKVFTFVSTPTMVIVNGAAYRDGAGVTIVGTTATLDNPIGNGGDIYGL